MVDKIKADTVGELIEALSKLDPKAYVNVEVEWAKDTATADEDQPVTVTIDDDMVTLSGWLSGCGATLD